MTSSECGSTKWQLLGEQFCADLPADAIATVGVVVGCSGGADSVALTRLIAEHSQRLPEPKRSSRPPLRIAHFNHGLRGQHSDADEQLVRDLADSLGIDVVVGRPGREDDGDAEANLRQIRRDFFHDVAAQSGCRYVALAHSADDQAETVLHHLLRGTGTQGMAGIRPASPLGRDFVILRPLLRARREAIRSALVEQGYRWREDASNESTRYTRNWIRNDVLPLIETRFPHAGEALQRAADNQNQLSEMLGRLAQQWLAAFVELPSASRPTSLKIHRPGSSRPLRSRPEQHPWPHGEDLACEPAIVIAACQSAFDAAGWPRGEMNREHWSRLGSAIVQPREAIDQMSGDPAVRLGHWPGHVEGIQRPEYVILRRASRG
ncbi:tRNA lysidine(34) synthetase TilS [Allorhodopirellula solitaria]|uniref:tRNA(Ile)-lysidine synthase n=1 Tax=Allorhodopirellula solitaria TaxID=2527987 RepID=A0A5C5X1C4_9BACT|nr:tRNA lysidine(34) synthetase TilS [Allorhodopirellula solitaria]TWT55943.1 tRNA(Ile)-lysidine synthase [Allorhodopirellula solitaria]